MLAAAFLGAERVARAGRMRTTLAHDAVLMRWRHNANPLEQFLADDEWVELDPEARVHSKADLYETYRKWAASTGFRNPFGRNHFVELLEATGAARGVLVKRIETREIVTGVRLLARANELVPDKKRYHYHTPYSGFRILVGSPLPDLVVRYNQRL